MDMSEIGILRAAFDREIEGVIEFNAVEIPDALKNLAVHVGKIFENWLSSLSPALPADQRTALIGYAEQILEAPKLVSASDLADELRDVGDSIFNRFQQIYDRLSSQYEGRFKEEVGALTNKCNALTSALELKEKAISEKAISEAAANAALKSVNAIKALQDSMITTQQDRISIYEIRLDGLEQYKLNADRAIKILKDQQNASTALLKNAGSVLGSRLNIVGITFVALGAILLGLAYGYKDHNSFLYSMRTRFEKVNQVIDRFHVFMGDQHVHVARVGGVLAFLGTICLISSQVATGRCGRDIQGHLSLPALFG